MRYDSYAMTQSPPERGTNDDFVAVDPGEGVFVIADGMGGRPAGNVASRIAGETFMHMVANTPRASRMDSNTLGAIVSKVNEEVRAAAARDPLLTGLGTTLSAVVLVDAEGRIVHVGDTRVYRSRGGELEQLTRDHTLVAEMEGRHPRERLSPEFSQMLARAIGAEERVEADIEDLALKQGDWLILVTDGVTKALSFTELRRQTTSGWRRNARSTCRRIIRAAMEKRPEDDVSVAVVGLSN